MERVCQFLKDAGTYFLATAEGDQPRVRPFGTVHIYNGKLYIQTGNSKPVAKQLKANPKAEICAFHNGEWIRVAGELVEDDTEEERTKAQESLLEAYPDLKRMYKAGDGNTAVYYFRNATATISSFTKAPEVITF
ncbi:MAG: pyridoxamine 5'-phosphate oxidase family protein [Solobacterium sp.]|nr:pyridoxamine 5'-phosphate oxidase family protein [Solobacterium sp.]